MSVCVSVTLSQSYLKRQNVCYCVCQKKFGKGLQRKALRQQRRNASFIKRQYRSISGTRNDHIHSYGYWNTYDCMRALIYPNPSVCYK